MIVKEEKILQTYFGYETFRPGQKETIENILQTKNTLAVMPTGGGKSLCYQIPGLSKDGTAIIISPLISLMKDQVDALQSLGIARSKEHTSELQSRGHLVCRLLLAKRKHPVRPGDRPRQ